MKYRINYSRITAQANSIADDASRLSAQIRQLEQMEQDCRTVWKGQASDAFLSKLAELRNEMNRTKSQMTALASVIRYCADEIRRQEEIIKEQAAGLQSGQ